MSRMIIDSP
uniref:Uncharacterized protein n=1 Tax=Rhizophora mucronata TaxID=61149 RepID=A0A2P2QGP3_RHIMU